MGGGFESAKKKNAAVVNKWKYFNDEEKHINHLPESRN
jgi:hypothetical protein